MPIHAPSGTPGLDWSLRSCDRETSVVNPAGVDVPILTELEGITLNASSRNVVRSFNGVEPYEGIKQSRNVTNGTSMISEVVTIIR